MNRGDVAGPTAFRRLRAAAALLGFAGWAHAQQPAPAPSSAPRSLAIPGGALVAPGSPPDLTILYTGDVVGYLEPCG